MFRKLFAGREPIPDRPDRVRGAEQPAEVGRDMAAELRQGRTDLEVVGESNYQEALWSAVGGRGRPEDRVRSDVTAVLVAETDNPYDPNAISVWLNGLKVGYLSRADAERYRPGLIALESRYGKRIALPGVIAGGGMREDGPGRLGIFLRHDPADFGFEAPEPRPRRGSRMDTGLTNAIASDETDDAYDLSWVGDLPDDPIRAIPVLRQLLANERDAIDRHFMFHHLESALYKSREAFTSALDEYDECCRQHDAEMPVICDAFVGKWELHTYKQMCIRQAKVKNFEQALWWAERGLSVYGLRAARSDAIEDLRGRAETYRAKLAEP